MEAWATSDRQSLVHHLFSAWCDALREKAKLDEINAARERSAHLHNQKYEKALEAWATSDMQSLVHYFFSAWRAAAREKIKQDELDAARARMTHLHNHEYEKALDFEKALEAWATSNMQSLVHFLLSVWCDALREPAKWDEIDAARERMARMHNETYGKALKARALIPLLMSDTQVLARCTDYL